MIIINSEEDIYPSLEALDELGIKYEVKNDGKIFVGLDTNKIKIGENKDVTHSLSNGNIWPNADPSLSYFVIKNHRIIASGDLKKNEEENYICNGAFRVFSKINISTFDYIFASQNESEELNDLNGLMLNSTSKSKKLN